MTDGLHGLHGRDARTREDSIEIIWTPIGDRRTRYRFEPATSPRRWALYESRWSHSLGEWRHVGTVPVTCVQLDVGGERR